MALFLVLPAWAGQQVYLAKDINPTTNGSNPADFVVGLSYTFFTANDGIHGEELWRTDGTPVGTVMLKDIGPGDRIAYVEWPTNVGKRLFFVADDGTHGSELWKSDGTTASTIQVATFGFNSVNQQVSWLTNANGVLYLVADTGSGGRELWKSDGTAADTVQVADIASETGSSDPSHLTNVNGTYDQHPVPPTPRRTRNQRLLPSGTR